MHSTEISFAKGYGATHLEDNAHWYFYKYKGALHLLCNISSEVTRIVAFKNQIQLAYNFRVRIKSLK